MDQQIVLIPVQPPPPYIVSLFPSKPDSTSSTAAAAADHYSKLAALLSSPTSYVALSPPIPLPSSLFDAASIIPEIKGCIPCVDFRCTAAYIVLHASTKFELSSAYDCFLQSYPNRYVPAHIKESWRSRFWRNMDLVQWTVHPAVLTAIDPATGFCDLTRCFVPRGCCGAGGPQVVTLDGKLELAAGVLHVLDSVADTVKQLFAPALDEKRDIWRIPYRVEPARKSQFRIREEFRLDEGIFDYCRRRPLDSAADWPVGIAPTLLTAKRRKRPRAASDSDSSLSSLSSPSPSLASSYSSDSCLASSSSQHRPCRLKIVETETGGKTAVRRPLARLLGLCHTADGQAYIGLRPPALPRPRPPLLLPVRETHPAPSLPPSPSPPSPSPSPSSSVPTLPPPPSSVPTPTPPPPPPQASSSLLPLPSSVPPPPPQLQPLASCPVESYPTPPADLSLPPIRPMLQSLSIADQRPSAPFELPSPILSAGDDGNDSDYRAH